MDGRTGKMIVYDCDDYDLVNRLNGLLREGRLTLKLEYANSRLRRDRQSEFDRKLAVVEEEYYAQGWGLPSMQVDLPDVSRAVDKMERIADTLAQSVAGIQTSLQNNGPSVVKLGEAMQGTLQQGVSSGFTLNVPALSRLSDQLNEMVTKTGPGWMMALKFSMALANVPQGDSWKEWGFWILNLVLTCDLGMNVFNGALSRFFQGGNLQAAPVTQVGAQLGWSVPRWGGITLIISELMNRCLLQGTVSFQALETLVKRFGMLARGITSITGLCEKIWSWVFPAMFRLVYGVTPATFALQTQFKGLKEWRAKLLEYVNIDKVEDLRTNASACKEIEQLYKQGFLMMEKATECKLPREEVMALQGFMRLCKELYDKVLGSGAKNRGARMEPVVVCFHGTSGVGKTTLTSHFNIAMIGATGMPKDEEGRAAPFTEIYVRNAEQEFWCGYSGQRLTMFDDWGQQVDSPTNPNLEYLEIIRTGHIAEYPLNMADLESKDKTFFRSEVIVLTTNLMRIAPTSIICPEAVRRRITHGFVVTIREEFRRDNSLALDVNKVCCPVFCPHAYEFHVYDEVNEVPTGEVLTYAEMLDRCQRAYTRAKTHSNDLRDFMQKTADEILAQQSQPQVNNEADDLDILGLVGRMGLIGSPVVEEPDFAPEVEDLLEGMVLPILFGETKPVRVPTPEEEAEFQERLKATNRLLEHLDVSSVFESTRDSILESSGDVIRDFVERQAVADCRAHMCGIKGYTDPKNASECLSCKGAALNRSEFIEILLGGGVFSPALLPESVNFLLEADDDAHFQERLEFFQKDCPESQPVLEKATVEYEPVKENYRAWLAHFTLTQAENLRRLPAVIRQIPYVIRKQWNELATWESWQFLKEKFGPAGLARLLVTGVKDCGPALRDFSWKWCLVLTHGLPRHVVTDALFAYWGKTKEYLECMRWSRVAARLNRFAWEHPVWTYYLGFVAAYTAGIAAIYYAAKLAGMAVRKMAPRLFEPKKFEDLFDSSYKLPGVEQQYDVTFGKPAQPRTEQQYDVTLGKPAQPRTEQQYDTTLGKPAQPRVENETRKTPPLMQIYSDNFLVPTMKVGLECTPMLPSDVPAVQSSRDPCARQIATKLIKNVYYLECCDAQRRTVRGVLRGFFIRGRVMLTARHFRPYVEQATHLHIANGFNPSGWDVPTSALKLWDVTDAAGELKDQMLIEFPRLIPDHGDLMDHLATSEEISKFTVTRGCLVVPGDYIYIHHSDVSAQDRPVTYNDDVQKRTYHLRTGYVYAMETQAGDCGSPLLALNAHLRRKIIGLHVAGGGTDWKGFSSPINAADIKRALENTQLEARVGLQLDTLVKEVTNNVSMPEGNFVPVGVPAFVVRNPTKTSFVPSSIQGTWREPITRPAALKSFMTDRGVVDPLMNGLKKAGENPVALEPNFLSAAVNAVSWLLKRDPARARVCSLEEASCGIEGDSFAVGIPRSTSAGYPYKFMTKKPGKKEFLGETKDDPFIHPQLRKEVEQRIQRALEGERYPTLWCDTKKDERRPIAKVQEGKTRIFSAGPIDFTLAFRQYFLGFAASVMENRIDNEIAVGTNVYSSDWMRIAEKMRSKGTKVIAGDFSNYDGTLNPEMLWAVLDVINDWYQGTAEEAQVRTVLWKEIVNSVHVYDGTVYLWNHSQPSGNPLTAILNSVYNILSLRYVWISITVGTKYHTMGAFAEHVAAITYGDDNTLNVSDEVIALYNQVTMAEAYAKIGMTYTDETKSGQMVPFRTLEDVQFLKRKFVYDKELARWRAPLTLETILEMPNWVRKTPDINTDAQTCLNVEAAVRELAIHGKEVFELHAAELAACCKARGLRPQIGTYYEYAMNELTTYGGLYCPTGVSGGESVNLAGTPTESPDDQWCLSGQVLAQEQHYKVSRAGLTLSVQVNHSVASSNQEQSITKEEITKFVDDVSPVVSQKETASAGILQDPARELRDHTIVDVLQRPVLVSQGSLTSSDLGPVFSLSFPEALITLGSNKLQKLNYFTYLRANVKVRLVVNAQPFQAGRYYLCFAPFETYSDRMMTGYCANVTGYPGVEVDLSAHQAVELKIPYCSPLSHYNLVQGTSTMGELYLRPLSPLASGASSTDCGYSLYAWFEDIELSLPTGVPVKEPPVAQVGVDFQRMKKKFMGMSTGKSDSKESGFISSSLKSFSRAQTYRPVKWLAGAAAGVAESEGFSKPSQVEAPDAIANIPAKGFTHADGLDHSTKLATTANNSLPVPKTLFSSDIDEMDINYVAGKMTLLFPSRPLGVVSNDGGNIIWDVAHPANHLLKRFPVTPTYMGQMSPSNSFSPTLCAYVASLFEYWAGSMDYRFSVVKTAFHSGRLRIAYYPGVALTDLTAPVRENAYNVVLDLSESSETSMHIEYNNNKLWARTAPDLNTGTSWRPNDHSMGYIEITVLNPLRAVNSSVSDKVEIMVGMAAGPDMRFARPTPDSICPVAQVHGETQEVQQVEEGKMAPPLFQTSWKAGMGEELSMGEEIRSLRQLTRRFTEYANLWPASSLASGEDPYVYQFSDATFDVYDDAPSVISVEFDTAYFGRRMSNEATPLTTRFCDLMGATVATNSTPSGVLLSVGEYSTCTLFHLISHLYRFYTGSTRFKAFQGTNTEGTLTPVYFGETWGYVGGAQPMQNRSLAAVSRLTGTNFSITPPTALNAFTRVGNRYKHIVKSDLNGVMEVEVPWMNTTPFAVVTSLTNASTTYGEVNDRTILTIQKGPSPRYGNTVTWLNGTNGLVPLRGNFPLNALQIKIAAGDDFTFGYLVGAPPVQFNPTRFYI